MQVINSIVNLLRVRCAVALSQQTGNAIVFWGFPLRKTEDRRCSMKSKETTIPLEHWIGYRFGLVAARFGNFCEQMYASRHDLTIPAWRSLAVIARYQPLTAKQLATLTSSDAFKVTRAIELLVKRGLIRRDVDSNDRRRASLSLTAEGRKVYKDIEKFVVKVENELVAALDARELSTLRRSVDKLEQHLESHVRTRDWENFLKG